jgi:hypothetical protein
MDPIDHVAAVLELGHQFVEHPDKRNPAAA